MMSAGCHHLVREGGAVLASASADVLECLLPADEALAMSVRRSQVTREATTIPADTLTAVQARVRDLLPSTGEITLDDLRLASGLSVPELLSALGALSSLGFVAAEGSGWVRRA
jgi:DNA processing protein